MRKKYRKPKIKSIRLKPEEAVLTQCKMSGTVGGGPPTDCRYRGTRCSEPGS